MRNLDDIKVSIITYKLLEIKENIIKLSKKENELDFSVLILMYSFIDIMANLHKTDEKTPSEVFKSYIENFLSKDNYTSWFGNQDISSEELWVARSNILHGLSVYSDRKNTKDIYKILYCNSFPMENNDNSTLKLETREHYDNIYPDGKFKILDIQELKYICIRMVNDFSAHSEEEKKLFIKNSSFFLDSPYGHQLKEALKALER